jgi:hypothetical protein
MDWAVFVLLIREYQGAKLSSRENSRIIPQNRMQQVISTFVSMTICPAVRRCMF